MFRFAVMVRVTTSCVFIPTYTWWDAMPQCKFKRCGCMKGGERFACIPPDRKHKCERVASVVKMRVQTEEQIRVLRYESWEKMVGETCATLKCPCVVVGQAHTVADPGPCVPKHEEGSSSVL